MPRRVVKFEWPSFGREVLVLYEHQMNISMLFRRLNVQVDGGNIYIKKVYYIFKQFENLILHCERLRVLYYILALYLRTISNYKLLLCKNFINFITLFYYSLMLIQSYCTI